MRKLVLILIVFIALFTFIRAFDIHANGNSANGQAAQDASGQRIELSNTARANASANIIIEAK